MRVLIVGAGAVGQVYGRHLQRGGAEVSFYVREKHADECRRGFHVYPLNDGRDTGPVKFEGFGVLTTPGEVRAQAWDAVILCVSSTGLRPVDAAREWFPEFAAATGEATIVALQPGPEDHAYVARSVPTARVAGGVISFVAYHAPLPVETRAVHGVAYWFPPLTPVVFSGEGPVVQALVATARRGGMPSKRGDSKGSLFVGAVLNLLVAGLELEGWSFAALRRSSRAALVTRAAREALAIVSAQLGRPVPFGLRAAVGVGVRGFLLAGPRVTPFDFEAFIRAHFTKVGDQTRRNLDTLVREAQERRLAASALQEISSALRT